MSRAVVCFLLTSIVSLAADSPPMIYMIGDSTMADKPMGYLQPERGWGQLFREYVKNPEMISNHAMNGRSTKSFLFEKRWDYVKERLAPGDFVIIQFGHNDEKTKDSYRFTDPQTDFRENLRTFLAETRAKGAQPILATPVCRRRFDERGAFFDTHGKYPDAVRRVAREENVPLLELHHSTEELIKKMGPEESKKMFLWIKPGEYEVLPQGLKDDTHFSEFGAREVCRIVVREARRQQLPLAEWLRDEAP